MNPNSGDNPRPGSMVPGDMITSKISLEDVVEKGIKELIKNKEQHVKLMVEI